MSEGERGVNRGGGRGQYVYIVNGRFWGGGGRGGGGGWKFGGNRMDGMGEIWVGNKRGEGKGHSSAKLLFKIKVFKVVIAISNSAGEAIGHRHKSGGRSRSCSHT